MVEHGQGPVSYTHLDVYKRQLEDNLMRIFASDWVQKAMKLIGMKEDLSLIHI